ncbi:MAG: alpha-glucan family phosphorylase [Vicinamibacterales bacterium]
MERFAIPFPARIHRIGELATDVWWSWHPAARELFRRLDLTTWRSTAHNPARMLRTLGADVLQRAAADPAFVAMYDAAIASLDAVRQPQSSWWAAEGPDLQGRAIAYFSAEFALHQSLPIYAGGLGVLAGDHCKEASDLGLPLVGVGFMYPQGYFHQRVSSDGWQQEHYERINWADAPIETAITPDGRPCITAVPIGERTVLAAVWRVRVGHVRLYLLDTDLEENAPWDRELSARLYGGDRETRIQQEVVLGIGGVRVLRAMGIEPAVWHLNEGHAAFVVLQRIREFIEQGQSFDEALEAVRRSTVFTTHTPVPAGHDAFPFQLVEKHLAGCWGDLGPHRARFLALGEHDSGHGAQFNMTALALRTAGGINAVSELHGHVTREMWRSMWPDRPVDGVPVQAITNGVHVPTWVAAPLRELLSAHLGEDWLSRVDAPETWQRFDAIPDEEIWEVRVVLRQALFAWIRERARQRWTVERVAPARVATHGLMLDPNALTLGYARRFAAYKRPELIFHDAERLAALLNATGRPVQIVFAGKAHPADDPAKHHLQRVFRRALDPMFGGRVAFIDDYDLHVAHLLVQGCDVWVNTPRKPLEASGTSGMKAALNGVPHLSIGDGWWAEGYTGDNGWLIDGHADANNHEAADAADADALYAILERDVIPAFYERDERGVPRAWMRVVREAMRTNLPRFSTARMLKEYVRRLYAPAAGR